MAVLRGCRVIFGVLACLLAGTVAQAAEWTVRPGESIAAAIARAAPGDPRADREYLLVGRP